MSLSSSGLYHPASRSDTYLGSSQEEIEAHQQLARDNADKLIRYMNARIR